MKITIHRFQGEVNIEICVYDIIKSKIQRVAVTAIPLQTQVCCHSFSPDNEKLMLGCIDGSVVLFDEGRGITHLIKAAFVRAPNLKLTRKLTINGTFSDPYSGNLACGLGHRDNRQ